MTIRKAFSLASLLLGLLLPMLPAWAAEEGDAGSSASFRAGVRRPTPPRFMHGKDGSLQGMGVDIYEEIGRRIGRSVEFRLISDVEKSDELLMRGDFDISLTPSHRPVDPALIKSPAYLSLYYQLYVHKDFDAVFSISDLEDLVVGYTSIGTRELVLNRSRPRMTMEFTSVVEGMLELDRRHIHAFLVFDRDVGEFIVRDLVLRNVVAVGPVLDELPMSVVGRKEDAALVESVSRTLREMKSDGTLERIAGRWIRLDVGNKYWERYGRWGLLGAVALVLGSLGVVFWNQQLQRMVAHVTADLHASERRYRMLVESAPFMALLVGHDGEIHFANSLAVQELGLPRAEHPGNLLDHVLEKDNRQLHDMLSSSQVVLGTAETLTFQRPGQDPLEVEFSAVERPVDTDSTLTCCFLRNVTQDKIMERVMQEQDRLAIVGAMSAGFAHEINNPLAIIQANIDNLQSLDLPQEEREGLASISRSLERVGSLSQRLLLLSKTGEMNVADVDLNDVVTDCLGLLRHKLRDVDVREDLAPGGAFLSCDVNLVSHVLLNLVLNAVEAMSPGPGTHATLQLRTRVSPDGSTVALCVQDGGAGMPRENLLRIFDLFFTSGKPKGVGLGLYLCQRIVLSHGGIIYAQSAPGAGAILTLELPSAGHVTAEQRLPVFPS